MSAVPPRPFLSQALARVGDWCGLDRAGLMHGLRLFLAAWIAFGIAAVLEVPNAYWAAMPVWVVAQPLRGLLFERGVFRVLGTLLGAALGIAILALPTGPWIAFALLGAVVGASALTVHTLRGLGAYGALLTGMTAAVVVLPTVLVPSHTLDLALARVECTLIGVVVVTIVTGLFTPEAARDDFYRRVRRLCADVAAHAARVAGAAPAEASGAATPVESDLLARLADIDANARLFAAGSARGYRRLHYVEALTAAALGLLAASRALGERRARGEAVPADLPDALRRVAARLGARSVPGAAADETAPSDGADPDRAPTTGRSAIAAHAALGDDARTRAAPVARSSWHLPAPAPADPLRERFDATAIQLVAAEDALFAEADDGGPRSFGPRALRIAAHRDWSRGRRAAFVSGLATFAAACAAFASGWPAGELCALGVCIFSMVLGSLPEPRRIARVMFPGVLAGVVVAIGYRFGVQPIIGGTAALLLTLAPFLLAGGLARASRRFALPALDANMCFLLASQAGMPAAGAAEILEGGAALVLAAALVCGGFLLLPGAGERDADRAARHLGRDLLRLLPRLRPGTDAGDWGARATRQVLRLALHLARARPAPLALLGALNLGHAIVGLRAIAADADMDPLARQQAARALSELRGLAGRPDEVAAMLRAIADSHRLTPATPLLLDGAAALAEAAPVVTRRG
ncbi:FUSC family protein [Derxia gummosa]|uniref:FUSC family protein n=1 Tax=Derxia gummosa DSM 723 TaxID=1121388 RepID=A0A8B6X279_9BURK|nr:FUSC family protein [Derxia gummosa]